MGLIVASTFPVFPRCPGYGFTSQPGYLVNLVRREGGFERSDRRWARPQIVFSAVPLGPRDEEEIQDILNFWHAMGGRAETFVIKDWTDYKSCPTWGTPTALDQPLVPVALEGGGTGYQLVKRYTVGALSQDREITKPVGATIVVANGSGTPDDSFRVDENTGLLKAGEGFDGTPTTWGGEFLVPVRFDSELNPQIVDKRIEAVEFTLREKRLALTTQFSGGGGSEGLTWEATSYDDVAITFYKVVYGEGKLVGLGTVGSGLELFLSSDDGDSWTSVLPFSTSNVAFFPCLAYGNGRFVMAGADATSGASIVYTSDDGSTWTARTSDNIGSINAVVYAAGSNWAATSADSFPGKYATSSDNGATWSHITTTAVDQFCNSTLYYDSGTIVGIGSVGGSGLGLVTSADNGATWSSLALSDSDFSYNSPQTPLYFDGASYILGGSKGGTFLPAVLVGATPSDLAAATSVAIDGMASGGSVQGVIKDNGVFFAMSGIGEIANSSDGVAWALGDTSASGDTLSQSQESLAVDATAHRIIAMLASNMIRLVVT